MKARTVVRTYSAGFMATTALVAFMSFTQPVKSERPAEEQAQLYENLPLAVDGKATKVEPGEALAYIRIPRLGDNWLWTTSEGTTMDVLQYGPGHFIDTALPGDEGNSAFAAHRTGYGDPFIDFDILQEGDEVIVAQSGATWTYRIRFTPRIIEPDESWVTMQTRRGGNEFASPRLTLVTCWPKYGSSKRMYVRAELVT